MWVNVKMKRERKWVKKAENIAKREAEIWKCVNAPVVVVNEWLSTLLNLSYVQWRQYWSTTTVHHMTIIAMYIQLVVYISLILLQEELFASKSREQKWKENCRGNCKRFTFITSFEDRSCEGESSFVSTNYVISKRIFHFHFYYFFFRE